MTRNVPITYDALHPIIYNDTMVNQPDDTDSQINPVFQFLANANNA